MCDLYAFVAKTDINCSENGPIEHPTLKWITHLWQEPKVNKMNFRREIDPFQLAHVWRCYLENGIKNEQKRSIYDDIDVL